MREPKYPVFKYVVPANSDAQAYFDVFNVKTMEAQKTMESLVKLEMPSILHWMVGQTPLCWLAAKISRIRVDEISEEVDDEVWMKFVLSKNNQVFGMVVVIMEGAEFVK